MFSHKTIKCEASERAKHARTNTLSMGKEPCGEVKLVGLGIKLMKLITVWLPAGIVADRM